MEQKEQQHVPPTNHQKNNDTDRRNDVDECKRARGKAGYLITLCTIPYTHSYHSLVSEMKIRGMDIRSCSYADTS